MIALPTTVSDLLRGPVRAALRLLPDRMTSDEARVMLLAIALQESDLAYREQIGGPARGLWMFERGGGVKGVLKHHATRDLARYVCRQRGVNPNRWAVYKALPHDDVLAAGFARLLLWTDPHALPALGDQAGALKLYRRTWRPGKFAPERWPDAYSQAMEAIQNAA